MGMKAILYACNDKKSVKLKFIFVDMLFPLRHLFNPLNSLGVNVKL